MEVVPMPVRYMYSQDLEKKFEHLTRYVRLSEAVMLAASAYDIHTSTGEILARLLQLTT